MESEARTSLPEVESLGGFHAKSVHTLACADNRALTKSAAHVVLQ